VTFKRGFMFGSELELAYLTAAVSLAATGPGRFSLDRAAGWDDTLSGVECGLIALGAAALVSLLTLTFGHTRQAAEATPAS
jgi:hypothetical protein